MGYSSTPVRSAPPPFPSSNRLAASSQGEIVAGLTCRSGVWKTSDAQIACIHVVPDFGGVQTKISPARCSKSTQRALSVNNPL